MTRLFEFRWNQDFSPYFRLTDGQELSEQTLAFGEPFSLRLEEDRACTGYEKNGEYVPCVSQVKGTRKCDDCKKQEGMSAAQYCDGFNTNMFGADELEMLNVPHYLYFAFFDQDLIKVGVSMSGRGFLRQIEQGAQYSLIVAEGMWGVPARQMETTIRRTGMLDKIQSSQKKNLFFPPVTPKQAEEILKKLAREKLGAVTAHRQEFSQFVKEDPEFHDWSSYYQLPQLQGREKPVKEANLDVGEGLSGTLIAAKGPFLLLETPQEYLLLEAKKLKGYAFDLSSQQPGLHKKEGFQDALF